MSNPRRTRRVRLVVPMAIHEELKSRYEGTRLECQELKGRIERRNREMRQLKKQNESLIENHFALSACTVRTTLTDLQAENAKLKEEIRQLNELLTQTTSPASQGSSKKRKLK